MAIRKNTENVSIKDLMHDFLQENKLQKGMDLMAIKEAWADVMGSGVISYTQELQFKNGILIVKLTSSVLREELSYGKEKIIELINKKLNKALIKKIKLL